MKKININIGHRGQHKLSTHINIHHEDKDNPEIIASDYFDSLDSIIKDGECEEIVANFVLEMFTPKQIPSVMALYKKKLSLGGRMVIIFSSIRHVVRDFHMGKSDIEAFHNHVMGFGSVNKSLLEIDSVKAVLINNGMEVSFISTDDNGVTRVEAIKSV